MKKHLLLGLALCLFLTIFKTPTINASPTIAQLETGFKNIPDSIKTSVYWYWMSDNISKEGVVKDLKAMKSVGINRAFIGNIGGQNVPYGNVKILSNEWWDILHTTLKTATELNIEIGIFNSPGWSQSGGPWVKPEQSMRFLNSSETKVTGPLKFKSKLVAPNEHFQRVSVIAYKAPASFEKTYRSLQPKVSSTPAIGGLEKLIDGDSSTITPLVNNKPITFTFETENEATVRSIIIQSANKKMRAKGEAPAKDGIKAMGELFVKDGLSFRSIKKFEINRSNFSVNVGFEPNAPIAISIPETKSTTFQLVLTDITMVGAIAEIDLSETPKLERYPEKSLAKMYQTPLPFWAAYLWDVQPEITDKSQAIDPKSVIDITKKMAEDGTLTWSVPEGNWIIMQTGMTTTMSKNGPASPEGIGLETDKMSKKHIEAHFDAFLGEILRRIPAEDRKTWKVAVEDSYETGGQNWTDGFADEFTLKYGYSPIPYLPTLKGTVVGNRDMSDRFLWDLRRLIADKISYDYVGGLREKCHQNGLTTWLENYGHWGFPGEFLQYGGQSDEVAGEFWSEGSLGDIENRAAASCAHIYGKSKVSAESCTAGGKGFARYPEEMKQRLDRFYTEGINNTLLHLFIQQPDERQPGINAPFGNEFNRHNTWFSHMDVFVNYIKRTNFLLQQGNYIADVAYFISEDVPKMTGICDPELPKGYSFDYINAEVLYTRAKVKDGKIVLPDGMCYRMLVLPNQETMRPEFLKRILEMVKQGAVVYGPAPKQSPSLQNYPSCDKVIKETATELWGKVDGITTKSAKVGAGMIISGMDLQEALNLINVVPDCKFAANDPSLFIHRKLAFGDIYFISNQTKKTITMNPQFRVSRRKPELWNPTTGTKRDLPAYTLNGETTTVPLKLEGLESMFIVFNNETTISGSLDINDNFPKYATITEVLDPWNVTFENTEIKRGPKNPVTFPVLQDLAINTNDSIKYYSGTVIYKSNFELQATEPKTNIVVDLGKVKTMAKVKINGTYMGGVWSSPWKVDITSAIKTGENTIEVEVVTNWMNRLIGDQNLPLENRKTWCPINIYKANSPLDPSGLMGPVTIQKVNF